MNKSRKYLIVWYSGISIFCFIVRNVSAQESAEIDSVELSPFVVNAGESNGYRATSTLAGTRLRTDLRDLGSAISVMTEAMFEDTGATDAQTILSYGLNTEVSGVHGNFADGLGSNSNGRAEQDEQRINPQGSQRVRGLASASLTRNFFLTNIPFDSYNTNSVDINRGANSLLFGVGSPGGIINNNLNQAHADGKDSTRVRFRIGEHGTHRGSIDLHRVLNEGRLAIRIAGLYDDKKYQQKPAYEQQERLYGAIEYVLAKNERSEFLDRTTIRGNFEVGSTEGAPPNIVPPADSFSHFFKMPDASIANLPGVVIPSYHPDSGVPVESSRSHPELGLTQWEPKLTIDNRSGAFDNQVPTLAQRSLARMLAVVYPSANAAGPSLPFAGHPDVEAFAAQAQGAAKTLFDSGLGAADLVGNNFPMLISQSMFGGNRQGQEVPNYVVPVIIDRNVWDNENHMFQGLTNMRETSFDAANATLEQTFLNGSGGFELVFDQQTYAQNSRIPFGTGETIGDTGSVDIAIDISEYLMDGSPNPNLGRPMIKDRAHPVDRYSKTDRDSIRATSFVKLDFEDSDGVKGWLGNHTFTGFLNQQKIEQLSSRTSGAWFSNDVDIGASAYQSDGLNGGRRDVTLISYVGPSVLNLSSPDEVRFNGLDITLPEEGDVFKTAIWNSASDEIEYIDIVLDQVLDAGSVRKQVLDTEVLSWQGKFLNNHLVALYGWRRDNSKTYENIEPNNEFGIDEDLPDGTLNPDFIRLQNEATNPAEGQTRTWSLVGHVPNSWLGDLPFTLSAHLGESENFQPTGTRRNVKGEVLAPPMGTTKEAGFTLGMLNDKIVARFNWYETTSSGANSGANASQFAGLIGTWITDLQEETREEYPNVEDGLLAAGASDSVASMYSSYEDVVDEFISWLPAEIQAVRNIRYDPSSQMVESDNIPGLTATTDFVTEGFELEVVANLNTNWRVGLNAGKQKSIQSNTAVDLAAAANQTYANIQASPLGGLDDRPVQGANLTYFERYNGLVMPSIRGLIARDGVLARELREWRINLLTTYDFSEGKLKGFTLGGAMRYQTKNAVGNPNVYLVDSTEVVPDVHNPFFGPDQLNGDLWIGFQKTLNSKFDWKIQLNARNAFGDDDPIPVVINPDGALAVVRNANPREFFLTNTFSF